MAFRWASTPAFASFSTPLPSSRAFARRFRAHGSLSAAYLADSSAISFRAFFVPISDRRSHRSGRALASFASTAALMHPSAFPRSFAAPTPWRNILPRILYAQPSPLDE